MFSGRRSQCGYLHYRGASDNVIGLVGEFGVPGILWRLASRAQPAREGTSCKRYGIIEQRIESWQNWFLLGRIATKMQTKVLHWLSFSIFELVFC